MPEPDPIATEQKAIDDAITAARMAAAGINDASTDAAVMAADAAVAAAMAAIDGATRVSAGAVATARASLATISGTLATAKASRDTAMAVASQRMAISDALAAAMAAVEAVMDDSEDSVVTAAEEAIAAATAAINAAGHLLSSETMAEHAKVAALQATLDTAKSSRMAAMEEAERMRQEQMQADARRTEQLNAITMAIGAARTAVAAVNDASTQEQVDAANAAVANARAKIAEAADVSDDVKATHTASIDTLAMSLDSAVTSWETAQAANMELANQRTAISTAIAAARTAVAAVMDDSDDATVEAATQAIADARVAIAGASDVPAEEKAANNATVGEIMAQLDTAKESRMAAIEDRDKADADQRAADAKTAASLYAGIGSAPLDTTARTGGYDATDNTKISVDIDGDGAGTAQLLSATTMAVPDLHGWKGKQYTASGTGVAGTYEAHVYANDKPTEGDKFGKPGEAAAPEGYEYILTAAGETADITTLPGYVTGRVDSPSFDQGAGVKTFDLPTNTVRFTVAGSYHGVSGNYYCTPTDANTKCSSSVAAMGFTLAGGTWTFKPTNPEARVTTADDDAYASYGWWLHTAADGTLTASAFAPERGTVADASGVTALQGSATYMGGAAGKYALSSALPGGVNDAGHFTARATLNANFTTDRITGTIDQFVGGDGESKDWSVKLNQAGVSDTGEVIGTANGAAVAADNPHVGTVWTIDGTAAAASGQWSGQLYENHATSGVPQVATGTFFSTYGTAGRMVGAFGVNEQ